MSFLASLVKAKTDLSIREMIEQRIGDFEKPRSKKVLHASDLTRDLEFCPREVALAEKLKTKLKGMYVGAPMRVTFDEGRDKQARLNNDYLRDIMVGHWRCPTCGHVVYWSRPPKINCPQDHDHKAYVYQEVAWTHKKWLFTGSTDALIATTAPKLRMVEVKIMAQDQWVDLKAPLAEHRLRTNLYLRLMAESEQGTWASEVDTDRATVLYWLRGYGKKTDSGEVTPFKEFTVVRNDKQTDYLMARAAQFWALRQAGTMPGQICPTSLVKRASVCPLVSTCFSGQYPPGADE